LEQLRDRAELAFALENIKAEAAFFLRRTDGPIPFHLPIGFNLGGDRRRNKA